MHIIGTAGHVDHGKSSLVRALTGTDPDRFAEEKLRGMTLDLGFAHLRFERGLEAGIVDVPGHERFLHNMLAGAAGMDMLLLVVAANEGPRPQTFEHLAVLEFLNIRRTIVVLSKCDLVDPEELALARALTLDALAGTFAHGAPAIAVSTVSGNGLETLRSAIETALLELPERAPDAPPYLPVDRVFALPGHGTIVTGTLMQGRIATGDELSLQPGGERVRVRSLHVFGEKRRTASGGTRVALNVPAVDTSAVRRGDVLASDEFASAPAIGVSFRALPSGAALLRRKTPVRAYIGSAEIFGSLAFDRVPGAGESVAATLRLRRPVIVVPGSAYVVRLMTPKVLLGGGALGSGAPAGDVGAGDDAPETIAVLAALRRVGLDGGDAARIGGGANLRSDRVAAVLEALEAEGRVVRVRRPDGYVDAGLASDVFERSRARLERGEHEEPWLLGVTSVALARSLGEPEPRVLRVLGAYVDDGRLVYRSGYYALPGFTPALSAEQRALFDRLFSPDAAAPNVPQSLETVRAALRDARLTGAAGAFETLVASGALVRVGDAVYRAEQIGCIRTALVERLRAEKQITVSTFRELAGVSRKYAVPLIEWFDAAGVTVRAGDVRYLRTRTTARAR